MDRQTETGQNRNIGYENQRSKSTISLSQLRVALYSTAINCVGQRMHGVQRVYICIHRTASEIPKSKRSFGNLRWRDHLELSPYTHISIHLLPILRLYCFFLTLFIILDFEISKLKIQTPNDNNNRGGDHWQTSVLRQTERQNLSEDKTSTKYFLFTVLEILKKQEALPYFR